jgi:hypothetical protein
MTATTHVDTTPLPHETPEPPTMATRLDRLNRLSVSNRSDAHADIPWDEPGFEVWNIEALLDTPDHDPMFDTPWYQALDDGEKARFACFRYASQMKIGIQFENILQRGLLRLAARQANGARSFRYLHHEIIEESQHSMMFQELIDRSGLPVAGVDPFWGRFGPMLSLGWIPIEPAFFFIHVLGGEEPVDHLQRTWLHQGVAHPLLERILRIHVTEEARHISFARHYLHHEVPRMGPIKRRALANLAPTILSEMVPLMLWPAADVRHHTGLPDDVVAQAARSEKGRELTRMAARKILRLFEELDLVTPTSRRIWTAGHLWSPSSAPGPDTADRDRVG